MSDLSRQSRAILEAGRHLDDPRPSDRARVRRALFARVAAGGAGGAVTLLSSSAAAAPSVAKVLLPLVLVAVGGVGGTLWWRARHPADATATSIRAAAPVAVAAPVVEPTAVAAPAPEPQVQPAPAAVNLPTRARARAVAPAPRNLRIETSMLAEANRALRDGEPRYSLRLLEDYDRRFPAGMLRQEMMATRIIARCQVAPGAATKEAARAFLAQYPASPLASRVRGSCTGANR
jgi:hypothetical protein